MRQMKDSGIEWIGEIPEMWTVEMTRHIFSQRNTKGNETPVLLAATQKCGMIPQEKLEGVVQVKRDTNLQTFKTIHKGDFVISLRSFQGGFEMSDYEGVCSPAYQVFYSTKEIIHQYYKYLFKSENFINKVNSFTVGIREGKNIQYVDFSYMRLPYPPLEIQQRIATFLDSKCGEVDSMIALQEEMISELQAYKQSVITEAVTHGLNPNVKMKDSGIEWIGEIPENWDVTRIKNISVFCPSKKEIVHEVIAYAPMECLRNDILEHKEIESSKITSGLTYFEEGDIIMAKVTPCFENGNIAIAKGLKNGVGFGSSELFVFRNKESVANRYLFYSLQNVNLKQRCCATMTGTGGLKRVSPIYMVNTYIIVPSLPEQQNIASYLDAKCSDIDRLISLKQEKIESLKAYKQSIIYEYVTGKLSVRC